MNAHPGIRVRDCEPRDLAAVEAIYAHAVTTGLATFEEVPPSLEEITRRYRAITGAGFPFLVAESEGRVLGYAYASEFRTRSAYRFTCENSVYVAEDAQRRGVGRALMIELIRRCEARGLRQMLAVIGDSGNEASIGLHRALGFEHVGTMREVGFKFGRWVDVVIMQRRLGAADSSSR